MERVNIVDIIDSYVQLKKAGKNFKACCPFHNEKTPSFIVSPDKNFYYCFGCNAHGTAIGFLMEYAHLEFSEAVHELASRAGMPVEYEEGNAPPPISNKNSELYEIMAKAAHYYQKALRQPSAKIAVDYLKNRGLTGEIARDFGLGYAPQQWDNILNALGLSVADQRLLLETGLVKKSESGHLYDRFRHRIMFPILDHKGRVVAFGGRLLSDNQKEAKYLNSPETPLFQKGNLLYAWYSAKKILSLQEVIVVEGYMDVLALAQYEIRNAVATLGTTVNEHHLNTLFRTVSKIVFCFDGDEAGKKAAWRALETVLPLLKGTREVYFMFLPQGDDPDSLVRREGKVGFRKRLTQALPLSEFFFQNLEKQVNIDSIDGKSRLVALATPLLKTLSSPVYHDLMWQALSQKTSLKMEQLESINDAPRPQPQREKHKIFHREKSKECSSLICNMIGLLLQNPQLVESIEYPEKIYALADMNKIDDIVLLIEAIDFIYNNPNIKANGLLEYWRGSSFEKTAYQLAIKYESKPLDIVAEEFSGLVQILYKEYDRITESENESSKYLNQK